MIILTAECCILEDPDVIKNVEQIKIQDNKVVIFLQNMELLFIMSFTLCCLGSPGTLLFDNNRLLALQNSTGTTQGSLEKQTITHVFVTGQNMHL